MNIIKPKNKDHYNYYHHEFFHHFYDITRAFLEKDYETGMHVQEFYEINIITKGKGVHFIENNYFEASIGDVFIIPPHISHGYIGGGGFDVFHILLSDKFMQKFTADLQQFQSFYILFNAEPMLRSSSKKPHFLSLTSEQLKETNNILSFLLKHENHNNVSDAVIQSNYIMVLLSSFCKFYSENNKLFNENKSHSDEDFMNVISIIHERYYEKLTIEYLSNVAHISRSSFIKKFKDICKMPPLTYLNKIRIEAAKNLLLNTNYTIIEIANRTGFFDSPHFSRTFEKEVGITPSQYRKEH